MIATTKEISNKIRNISFIASIMVVFMHLGVHPTIGTPAWYFDQIFHLGLCRTAVPFFFLFSGFFLAVHFTEDGWFLREVRKRIISIYVPFLFWNLCWLFVQRGWGWIIEPSEWVRASGVDVFSGPVLSTMWYLRSLLIFVLLSGLWARFVRSSILGGVLVGGILCGGYVVFYILLHNGSHCYLVDRIGYLLMPVGAFCFLGIVCFYSGCFFRFHGFHLSVTKERVFGGASLFIGSLVAIILPIAQAHYMRIPFLQSGFALPFLMVGIWYLMPKCDMFGSLAKYSFPIYVVHYFFCAIFQWQFPNRHDSLAIIIFGGCFVVGASLLTTWLIRRVSARWGVDWIFGGR